MDSNVALRGTKLPEPSPPPSCLQAAMDEHKHQKHIDFVQDEFFNYVRERHMLQGTEGIPTKERARYRGVWVPRGEDCGIGTQGSVPRGLGT